MSKRTPKFLTISKSLTHSCTQFLTREGSGREKVSKRTPKFLTISKNLMVNKGATIKLTCDVDRLGELILELKKEKKKKKC